LVEDHSRQEDVPLVGDLVTALLKALPGELASAIGFCGMSLAVLPMQQRALDRPLGTGMEFDDRLSPQSLLAELQANEADLSRKTSSEVAQEILALQEWRRQMSARLQVLERHLAWSMLGIERTDDTAAISKAFKRRALELHPDKGGDQQQFQLLQDMKALLIPDAPTKSKSETQAADEGDSDTDDEIGNLLEPRKERMPETEKPSTVPTISLRKKLHQATLLAWGRFQELGMQLAQHESDKNAQREVLGAFEAFLSQFATEQPTGTALRFDQFIQRGSELVCAATLVDEGAALSAVAHLTQTHSAQDDRWGRLLEALPKLADNVKQFAALVSTSSNQASSNGEAAVHVAGNDPERSLSTAAELIQQLEHAEKKPDGLCGYNKLNTEGQNAERPHAAGCVCTVCLRRRWGFRR
ncbi:unnamed protein product, partial [Effrenium voratum]